MFITDESGRVRGIWEAGFWDTGGWQCQAAGPALSPGRAGEGLQGFTWSTGDGLCPGSQNPPPPLMSVPFPAVPSDHSLALTLALIRQGLDGPQILRQNVVILLESRPPPSIILFKAANERGRS